MISKMHTKGKGGFTLVEIMIVVAIIALLAAIAVPSFLRARLRSQASTLLNELRMIDAAKDQYMIENNLSAVAANNWSAAKLQPYLKQGSSLYNSLGASSVSRLNGQATITYNAGDALPSIDITDEMLNVAPAAFWSPYSAL